MSKPSHLAEEPSGYPYMTDMAHGWGRFGFGLYWGDVVVRVGPMIHDDVIVVLPHWFVAAGAGLVPARWLAVRRRDRRAQLRCRLVLCPVCGYDLRATPGRCPECGSVPAAGKGAA